MKKHRISIEDQTWLQELKDYLERHGSNNSLTVSMMAKAFSMSEPSLWRKVKMLADKSPSQLIKDRRLDKAMQLLETNALNSIAQVAYAVGYKDARSFARSLNRNLGNCPQRWQNRPKVGTLKDNATNLKELTYWGWPFLQYLFFPNHRTGFHF